MELNLWGPVRVFMVLGLLATLVGKMTTIVSNAISGDMSYHRG
jgi:hypothetical protein